MEADIRHFYLDFANFIGLDRYAIVNDDRYFLGFVGEWIFAREANEQPLQDEFEYLRGLLQGEYADYFNPRKIFDILAVRKLASSFIDYCLDQIDWDCYDVIGLTTSFQQSMASLALARRIKLKYPDKLLVFGGANCEGAMGMALHRQYRFIDVVVSGEGETILPVIVERYRKREAFAVVPNIVFRQNNCSKKSLFPAPPSENLDALPWLNYADFVADRERFPAISARFHLVPLFESARGCWWGAKHHCTFCGLNGQSMGFRSKSQTRAFDEIDSIAGEFGTEILVVDNILDYRYFDKFVPALSKRQPPLLLHYEVKVNLRADQLEALSRAGIREIQPGVESLCTRILGLMDKGTSALRNVQTLKLAAEAGIYVDWGHLYGFPGEGEADYQGILDLIPKILHLQPPTSFNRVRADRFSPYFDRPDRYSIAIVANQAYRFIYPFEQETIATLAYHFDIQEAVSTSMVSMHAATRLALTDWREHANASELYISRLDGRTVVIDNRKSERPQRIALSAEAAYMLATCAEINSVQQVVAETARLFGPDAANTLDSLLCNDFIVREGDSLLALPLRQPGLKRAPSIDDIRVSNEFSYLTSREAVFYEGA